MFGIRMDSFAMGLKGMRRDVTSVLVGQDGNVISVVLFLG